MCPGTFGQLDCGLETISLAINVVKTELEATSTRKIGTFREIYLLNPNSDP
jgi:hypothetical protein